MDPTDHTDEPRRDGRTEAEFVEGRPTADGEPAAPKRRGNRHHTARRRNRSRQAAPQAPVEQGTVGQLDTRSSNPSRMQGAMPSGRTPGKRAADDPGSVPLGTDDEAAGTRPTPEVAEYETGRAERDGGGPGLTAQEAMSGRPGHPEESPKAWGKLVTIAAVVVIALAVGIAIF